MTDPSHINVQKLIREILARKERVDYLAQKIRTPETLGKFDKRNARSWCIAVAGDVLIRVRLFIEQNFKVVETVGVIAVARYLLELNIWMSLFRRDENYGLVYFGELLDTQRRFYTDTLAQVEREIAFLELLEVRERAALTKAHNSGGSPRDMVAKDKLASDQIDKEATKHFSIYARAALTNGYGFQAHLVRTKALPKAKEALTMVETEKRGFDESIAPAVRKLIPDRWQWRPMANKVGLVEEYDYVYSFASKLLHATPASITTDSKNLEMPELEMFLKYIVVKIDDLMDLAAVYVPAAG